MVMPGNATFAERRRGTPVAQNRSVPVYPFLSLVLSLALVFGLVRIIQGFSRGGESRSSARRKRILLTIVMVGLMGLLIHRVTEVVRNGSRLTQANKGVTPATAAPLTPTGTEIASRLEKMKKDAARKRASLGNVTARGLESQLVQKKIVPAAARVQCNVVASDWDYVCTYLPTPKTSSTRVQFGVQVDRDSWTQISPIVPEGTTIATPQ